ncbi:hypothetical protein ACTXT7_010606 [Hymenolepis weldensis]
MVRKYLASMVCERPDLHTNKRLSNAQLGFRGGMSTGQVILTEVYATSKNMKVRPLSSTGCEWSLEHLEYVDDTFRNGIHSVDIGFSTILFKRSFEKSAADVLWTEKGRINSQ